MRNVRRPILTAALVLANVAAIALNAAILHRHGKLYPGYAIELAQGVAKYGLADLMCGSDPEIEAVYLKATAKAVGR